MSSTVDKRFAISRSYPIGLTRYGKLVFLMLLTFLCGHVLAQATNLPVAGVVEFDISAQNISCEGWRTDCNQELADGFRAMVETAIVKTKRMNVMERTRMDAFLQEQVISEHGLTEGGPSLGGISGIDYVIYGAITKFGQKTSGLKVDSNKGVGSLFGGRARQAAGGGLTTGKTTVEMEIDLKITDTQTSQIVVADYVGAEVQTGQAFSVGGITSADSSADPFADVQRVLASKIAEAVVTTKFPVKVALVQKDGTIILNYGNVFFAPGDQLIAFEVGEAFVDPDTGIALGAEETEIGRIEVTRSDVNISRAQVVGEPFELAVGSTVKRAKDVVQPKGRKKNRW